MKANLICKSRNKHPEKWQVADGNDRVHVWIDADGFHSQRFSEREQGGYRSREVESVQWDEMIMKSEGQLKLL